MSIISSIKQQFCSHDSIRIEKYLENDLYEVECEECGESLEMTQEEIDEHFEETQPYTPPGCEGLMPHDK